MKTAEQVEAEFKRDLAELMRRYNGCAISVETETLWNELLRAWIEVDIDAVYTDDGCVSEGTYFKLGTYITADDLK